MSSSSRVWVGGFTSASRFLETPLSIVTCHSRCESRYPSSKLLVLVDFAEKAYISGFVVLQAFVTLYPILVTKATMITPEQEVMVGSGDVKIDVVAGAASQMEFLPLMLTSVYCAVGLVWAFLRLGYLYIRTY